MLDQEMRLTPEPRSREMDQKAVFDAGYNAYESGDEQRDFGLDPEPWAEMWRCGWQRAQEDSVLPRLGLRF